MRNDYFKVFAERLDKSFMDARQSVIDSFKELMEDGVSFPDAIKICQSAIDKMRLAKELEGENP